MNYYYINHILFTYFEILFNAARDLKKLLVYEAYKISCFELPLIVHVEEDLFIGSLVLVLPRRHIES